jgi:predicted transcriptional regulator
MKRFNVGDKVQAPALVNHLLQECKTKFSDLAREFEGILTIISITSEHHVQIKNYLHNTHSIHIEWLELTLISNYEKFYDEVVINNKID